ncbi:MAG: transposase [Chthoniobacterales bacterium]
MFEQRAERVEQKELWIEARELPAATPDRFYQRVERTLAEMGFAKEVWKICRPAYAAVCKGGRPGIDPVVYLKMLMVGFFEDLPSERAIAARCADSLSIRGFLGYGWREATPDHSSLSVIRGRLAQEQFHAIHVVLLRALRGHGLLKGRQLGIDSSVIEANASLRALVHRNSEESYWDYVRQLAEAAGVDPEDAKAVRRFDRKRGGRKTSNQDWVNPHDPEAKVGRTKDGATDMIYKPEHVSDLESGAIVAAQERPGDAADTAQLSERIMAATLTLAEVAPEAAVEKLGSELAADEGYFALEEMAALQRCGVRTVVADPHAGRRRKDLAPEQAKVLSRARRATTSQSGQALLRRRGQHLERACCHLLDHGGLRRATLKGCENLSKRYLAAAMSFNLSLLLRTLFGIGTAKQWLAKGGSALWRVVRAMAAALSHLMTDLLVPESFDAEGNSQSQLIFCGNPRLLHERFSTGC